MREATAPRPALWESLTPPSIWGRLQEHAVAAAGVRVRTADGITRLCATSGLWNVPLGYGNEAVADAVGAALRSASYLSLFRSSHSYAQEAAEMLLARAGDYARVIFATSGAAANDLTMKLVRQAAALKGAPQKNLVVGTQGGYHGLSYGAFALTGEALGQSVYGVDRRAVRHVSPHDGGAQLRTLFAREGDRIAALVLEPVQGSGAIVLDEEFLATVAEIRASFDVVLVADEVATGFGRTGLLFASERWAVAPDVLLLSKALTNGAAAASAVLVSAELCDVFDSRDAMFVHAETQAGTPASCAAILAAASEFDRMDALRLSQELGAALDGTITRIAAHPNVVDTGGIGCFRSVVLARDGRPFDGGEIAGVVAAVRKAGAIVQPGPGCIQVIPAYLYGRTELDELETAILHGIDDHERAA
ncbi:aspartate aminotransferase family protein [Microbacterium sp. ISL-59]|uniref:daptide-type RiPP biosynthesis aminotransferase n=1 Tax=Microbacterium sp. ISL-59 TaxID=2819159 RepID=UPI001BECBCD4|nr:daptide-type RiPP biosynthesis aminotransferase [Microbacterium sp. ISL-59]MBT2497142.1 aspartate aminotransferase family protein [Microbacterium sp. ISL-59]